MTMASSQLPRAEWNRTSTTFEDDVCLSTLFRRQACATPEAPAVRFGAQVLSYQELNARSLALAARLVAMGAVRGQRIGIGLERSPEAIVAVFAVLATGAAYVPLDPTYPTSRLAFQIEDAGIALLITSSAVRPRLAAAGATQLLVIDDSTWSAELKPAVGVDATGGDLAYVIYTSGSTGQPKGVQIEHRSAVNFITWIKKTLSIGAGDCLLAQASLSFDMSVLDIFVTLTSGAALEIVPLEAAHDGRRLRDLIARSGATWMQATPSTWRLLVEAGLPAIPRLSAIVGGEALGEELAEALRERLKCVWNFYGPTETTVYSSAGRYEGGRPTIGRPIANTCLHVLDATGQTVAVGEAGELHVGGVGLARGYLNQPERTAEVFLSNLHLGEGAGRLYRTGDLARWTADGQLEYLGRNDHQVKVRGYRIELEEIESVLLSLPDVRTCAVVARPDRLGVQRLVAYVVPDAGGVVDPKFVKSALRRQLPEYMIPTAIVTLADLPLTPNQKIDRSALPEPTLAAQGVGDETEVLDAEEQVIAAVWQQELGVPIQSRHADFFEAGGHSLMALVTIMGLEEVFGRAIPLDSLWADGCTVAGMARIVRQLRIEPEISRLVHIRPGRLGSLPLFVIHTARGSVNEYFGMAHQMCSDHPVIGVRARGVYGEARPSGHIEDLARDCIEAMREHQLVGPYMVAGFSLGGLIAFEVASQLERAGEAVNFLGMFDTRAPAFKPYFSFKERLPWWLRRARTVISGNRPSAERDAEEAQMDEHATVSRFARDLQKALLASVDGYVPCALYGGHVDVFVVRNTARQSREATLGWRRWCAGTCREHWLQVEGHLEIMLSNGATELAGLLDAALSTALSNSSSSRVAEQFPKGRIGSAA